jgi:hypothetical protein
MMSIGAGSRGIAEDLDLGVALHRILALAVHLGRHVLVKVILAAVLADRGGHVANDHHGAPRCRLTVTVPGAVSPSLQMTHFMAASSS